MLVKSDIDYFSAGDVSNGVGEGMLFVIILGVTLIWERNIFANTASREAKLRSLLSLMGVLTMIVSFFGLTPTGISIIGEQGGWFFTYGAFLISASRLWSYLAHNYEDGTFRMPNSYICQCVAFAAAGVSTLLLSSNPTAASYCVIITDVTYTLGALLAFLVEV